MGSQRCCRPRAPDLLSDGIPTHHLRSCLSLSLLPLPPQRFISKRTVERVVRELREGGGGGSRPASRASSSTGSLGPGGRGG